MTNDSPMSAHVVLVLERPSRPEYDELVHPDPESKPTPTVAQRAKKLIEQTKLCVSRVGERELYVVGLGAEFEYVFRSRLLSADGDIFWEHPPLIPESWREVVQEVVLPPQIEFAV